ncbi:hypothetical protein Salat_0256700 [Sesamum alatum]|uniref:Myb/SANT-like domain-containing protein n=1 Tax=Sesamum alatum TaxID=300844 RepID=A0AAE2CYJ4_9LAMI|nr:hypothetical protein Salat_0256700 [Sesamum alatum]
MGDRNYVPNPPFSPPRQHKFFYTPVWTAAHDQVFIDSLWDQTMGGSIQDGGVISDEALQRATEQVNLVLKESFTANQNRPRVQKLRERYETFRYLISCLEVYWDRWDNTTTAPSAFWERMTLANPLAKAYEHFGDPNWTALLAILDHLVYPTVLMLRLEHMSMTMELSGLWTTMA